MYLRYRVGGVMGVEPVCPDVLANRNGIYNNSCWGPEGSVTFQNIGTVPLYVALMRADKNEMLTCYQDASVFPKAIRPKSVDPLMSKQKLHYCRFGSGDLYLVWWKAGELPPKSLKDAYSKPFCGAKLIKFNPFRPTLELK
jgi:hypothetical protein